MSDKNHFFVCLFKNIEKPGTYKAHAVSMSGEFGLNIEDHRENFAPPPPEERSNNKGLSYKEFRRIFEDFSNSMMGFVEMLPLIAGIGHTISNNVSSGAIKVYLNRNGDLISSEAGREIFRVSRDKYSDFDSVNQKRKNARVLGSQIPKMMILGVVSSFEHHSSGIFKAILNSRPEILNSKNIEINLEEISAFDSISDLKSHYIDHQVESIMRDSFEKQIETLEKYLGIKRPIRSNYAGWDDLNEIFERRNLFAHANGVVNKIYLSNVPGSKKELGDVLEVSSGYFYQSIQNMFEFGSKLILVSWRKTCKDDLSSIDDFLSEFCYSLMEGRQYSLAAKLLDFSLRDAAPQADKRKKMNIINLANCYRLKDDEKKAGETLDAVDWSAAGDDFQMCVASVRGELDEVLRLMKSVSLEKVEASSYENWPVFYRTRDNISFADTFAAAFGRPFAPAAEDRHSFMELMSLVQEDAMDEGASQETSVQVIDELQEEPAKLRADLKLPADKVH